VTLHKLQKSILSLKSWLFTPATKSDKFSRAAEVHADALIIDLEDSVAPSAKREARETAFRYLAGILPGHLPVALRVNSPDTRFGLGDLQALASSSVDPDYLLLPKCGSAAVLELVGNLLRKAGKTAQVLALIESAKGLGALNEIVAGDAKPAALVFGAADVAADLGAETAWKPLLWARSRIVQVAASAGIAALDSPHFEITDTTALSQETTASASLGFHGKCAIHPDQVAIINAALTPSDQQIAKAREILVVNCKGVGTVDIRMVDEAVARNAKLVLERAGLID
jgi:(S)-citramalyl-CoA lyase